MRLFAEFLKDNPICIYACRPYRIFVDKTNVIRPFYGESKSEYKLTHSVISHKIIRQI